jgi:hypothetical protein
LSCFRFSHRAARCPRPSRESDPERRQARTRRVGRGADRIQRVHRAANMDRWPGQIARGRRSWGARLWLMRGPAALLPSKHRFPRHKSARPTDDELRRTWTLVAGAMRTTCAAKAAAGRSIRSALWGRRAGHQVPQWTGTTRSGRVRRTASAACWVEMTRTERGMFALHTDP